MYRSGEFDAIAITSSLCLDVIVSSYLAGVVSSYLDGVVSSYLDVVVFRGASRWLTTASCLSAYPMVSLAVSALAGTCNVLQASTAISICLLLLELSWFGSNEDIT